VVIRNHSTQGNTRFSLEMLFSSITNSNRQEPYCFMERLVSLDEPYMSVYQHLTRRAVRVKRIGENGFFLALVMSSGT